MPDELMEHFKEVYNSANEAIRKRDTARAIAKYHEMMSLYDEISSSKRLSAQKEIAHSCLKKVYDHLQASGRDNNRLIIGILAIATILVLGIGAVLLYDPSIIGLAALGLTGECAWMGPSELTIEGSAPSVLDAQEHATCRLKGILVSKTRNVRPSIDGTSVSFRAANTGYEEVTLLLVAKDNKVERVPLGITIR